MSTFTLTELQHSNDRKGPWKLYIFEKDSEYHRGGVWFQEHPKYPEEGEITTAAAKRLVVAAVADGREVRVCDGGDMLVYHWKDGLQFGETFWSEIGRMSAALAQLTPPFSETVPALRKGFNDWRGRAPHLDGKPFVFLRSFLDEDDSRWYLIDVWTGAGFHRTDVRYDEIFHDLRSGRDLHEART